MNRASKWIMVMMLCGSVLYAASELTLNQTFLYKKGTVQIQQNPNQTITVNSNEVNASVILLTTNPTQIVSGNVSGDGIVFLNNATTNSWSVISYGTSTNFYAGRINAGESFIYRQFSTNIWLVATTNTSLLNYIILPP